ncbi:MAG TPA: glycosyltransferase [Deltaproteobacteria bacterium]|nr:MAG: glycosyltransferase [Deltaproteobacteria bacterium]HDM78516.1 glycosyltransferase [Deltaproteobacteria bacterium]
MPKKLPRLALFTTFLGSGGAERVTVNLAKGFRNHGLKVDLVLTRFGPQQYEIPSGVRLINIGAPRIYAALPGIIRYLRRTQPDIVLSMGAAVNVTVLLAWRLARSRAHIFISERNSLIETMRNSRDWRVKLLPAFIRKTYPWADGIVAVSKGVAEDLVNVVAIPKDKIRVIYNPLDLEELLVKAEQHLNHPWFREGEPPVILAAGRLTLQKDFTTLIYAFALVHKERPARLMILGEGKDRAQLEMLVRKLGLEEDVALPGFVKNPYKYMKRASVFVLSSKWEGLPNVLIEAMACGCPVVSTDCPSGPAEILENGKWGRLVPVQSPELLAKAILETLESPIDGTERARQFTLERVTKEYLRFLGVAE